MSKAYLSAAEVAEQLGCSKSTITRRAKKHSIGIKAGKYLGFTAADVAKLRRLVQAGPGSPAFTAGNDLWKRRKTGAKKVEK